jgi:hypothetical protein
LDYLFRSSVGKSESKVKPLKLLVQFTLILKEASYVLRYDVADIVVRYGNAFCLIGLDAPTAQKIYFEMSKIYEKGFLDIHLDMSTHKSLAAK